MQQILGEIQILRNNLEKNENIEKNPKVLKEFRKIKKPKIGMKKKFIDYTLGNVLSYSNLQYKLSELIISEEPLI